MIKERLGLTNTKSINDIIKSLGLVFGDIGTSPIYTLTVIFILTKPTESHVIGILSLIIWTLITIVTIQYAWLAMSLGQKGEGGTIVLKEILAPMLKSKYQLQATILLTFIGVSLLFGDGIITPFGIITIYTTGQKRLAKSLKPMDYDIFIEKYREQYKRLSKIRGTALFFVRDIRKIPSYIADTIIHNDIIYEDNVMVSIIILEEPYGLSSRFIQSDTEGLRLFEIKSGYNEVINIEKILKSAKINERIMFYGIEDIVTENIIWKIYSTIKKLAPAFVQFYELPSHKIHGIITRIEM